MGEVDVGLAVWAAGVVRAPWLAAQIATYGRVQSVPPRAEPLTDPAWSLDDGHQCGEDQHDETQYTHREGEIMQSKGAHHRCQGMILWMGWSR